MSFSLEIRELLKCNYQGSATAPLAFVHILILFSLEYDRQVFRHEIAHSQ